MKIFVQKVIWFIIGIPVILISIYNGLDMYYNKKPAENTLFIWGDSQAYQGIDLNILSQQSGRKVFSAAKHGASVYDFLSFVQKVPEHASVIVAISRTYQLRVKNHDRNKSGISLSSLKSLYDNNYKIHEITDIIYNNKRPQSIFQENTDLYPTLDTITLAEPLSEFETIYAKIPDYLIDKQQCILTGIDQLNKKNCKVILVDFPYHPLLKAIESKSPIQPITDSFKTEVLTAFPNIESDTLQLDTAANVMYDLTHLNKKGAASVSEKLADLANMEENILLLSIQWR